MNRKYWIVTDNVQRGPFTLDQLRAISDLTLSTPVWYDGLSDWTIAGAIPEIAALLTSMNGPTMQPYSPYGYHPAAQYGGSQPPMPPTYLVWAILATICCCIPLGIPAIIYSSRVSPAYGRGDYEGARRASERAGWWCIIAFVGGLVWTPFYMLYSLFSL